MKLFVTALLLFNTFINVRCQNNAIQIVRIEALCKIDTVIEKRGTTLLKSEAFLVQNYCENSSSNKVIANFVNNIKDSSINSYGDYAISFYKESEKTTLKEIKENLKIIDRYSNQNDLIFIYHYSSAVKGWNRYKLKNGEVIEPKAEISIEDVKQKLP